MPPHRPRPSPSGLASHGKSKGKFSTRPSTAPAARPAARSPAARMAAGSTGGKPAKSTTAPAPPASARPAAFPAKLSSAAGKRRRAAEEEEDQEEDDELGSAAEGEGEDEEEDEEVGTDEEIENAMERGRSSKTAKRKRRAVSPTSFGQALSAFLGDESDGGGASSSLPSSAIPSSSSKPASSSAAAQSQTHIQAQTQAPIFSLAPSISSRISSTKLSEKAARVALEERRSREDQFRVRDLIGGWGRPGEKPGQGPAAGAGAAVQGFGEDSDAEEGGEMDEWLREGGSKGFERRLRKVAQRGVVKLFNAIRAAQSTTTDDVEERNKGLSAASVPAVGTGAAVRPGNKNALGGKSKELADLSKANFLDLIRSGGGGAAAGKTTKA